MRIPFLGGRHHIRADSQEPKPRRHAFYRHSAPEQFENPIPSASRIAILAPNFQERQGVRCFAEEEAGDLEAFEPEILAGTVSTLLRLAVKVRVSRAVVVFSGSRLGAVSALDRDLLWAAYHVPLFEQRMNPEGRVVARECEAHEGLHVAETASTPARVLSGTCSCGKAGPRI